jgi:hypothetical protein
MALAALDNRREAVFTFQSRWPQVQFVLANFVPTARPMLALELFQIKFTIQDASRFASGLCTLR